MKYLFGKTKIDEKETRISDTDLFSKECLKENGCGFLLHRENKDFKYLSIPEINDGFDAISQIGAIRLKSDENGVTTDYADMGYVPVSFAVCVKQEGNYLVKLTLKAEADSMETIVFQSRRRLGTILDLKKGEKREVSFLVNVSPVIPRYHEEKFDDLTINISICGKEVYLCEIQYEKWEGPTVYIAGDSTVTDQTGAIPYLPERSYSGWGQMLSGFLRNDMAVSNHAHSGLTTESFRTEGHYDIVKALIKKGDYCLFQFGHNDQKLDFLKADTGYRERLIHYIDEIKEVGAIPVIISPLSRNTWKGDGEYNDLLVDYARVCEEVSNEKNILFIDLHKMSMELIKKMGVDGTKRFFFPSDYTHTNDYGAYLFARFIYEKLTGKKASDYVFEPPFVFRKITVMDESKQEDIEEPIFEDIEKPDDFVKRYEALELCIQTLKYFPTNVYNDMFTDVVGHEVYAGIIECAYQNGIIPKDWVKDKRIFPEKEITQKEFLDCLNAGVLSRTGKEIKNTKENLDVNLPIKRKDAVNWCRIARKMI